MEKEKERGAIEDLMKNGINSLMGNGLDGTGNFGRGVGSNDVSAFSSKSVGGTNGTSSPLLNGLNSHSSDNKYIPSFALKGAAKEPESLKAGSNTNPDTDGASIVSNKTSNDLPSFINGISHSTNAKTEDVLEHGETLDEETLQSHYQPSGTLLRKPLKEINLKGTSIEKSLLQSGNNNSSQSLNTIPQEKEQELNPPHTIGKEALSEILPPEEPSKVSVSKSEMSEVIPKEVGSPFSLGIESVRAERDTAYAIAFVNPFIRRLLKHYKDDPFWSEASKQIIETCLLDNTDEWLDPHAVLSLVEGKMSEAEKRRAIFASSSYLQARTPADAAVAAKTIIYRLKVSRLHGFLRDYDASKKTSEDMDRLIANVIYLSKHYGSPLEVKSLTELKLEGLYQQEGDTEVKIFPSFFSPMNEYLGFGGFMPGQLVSVAGAPGRGKTTFLLNEAVNMALSGRTVLYFALADMTEEDIVLKALSILAGHRLMNNIVQRSGHTALLQEVEAYYYDAISGAPKKTSVFYDLSPASLIRRDVKTMFNDPYYYDILSRIRVVADSETRPHIEDIQSTVMSMEEEPDVVIVDYDRSVKARTDEGLYQEGEEIYEGLVSIAKPKSGKRKLVMVASQINKNYWSRTEVPLEALAESSRKQAISDIVITVGKDITQKYVHVGAISLVKERRGRTSSFGYILLPTNQVFPWDLEEIMKQKGEEIRKRAKKSSDSAE